MGVFKDIPEEHLTPRQKEIRLEYQRRAEYLEQMKVIKEDPGRWGGPGGIALLLQNVVFRQYPEAIQLAAIDEIRAQRVASRTRKIQWWKTPLDELKVKALDEQNCEDAKAGRKITFGGKALKSRRPHRTALKRRVKLDKLIASARKVDNPDFSELD